MEIDRQPSSAIHLSQKQHRRFDKAVQSDSREKEGFLTPMNPDFGDGHKYLKPEADIDRNAIPYRQAIGKLLYL